ncbi:SAM-dependent methyltransferase [Rhodococcus sp. Leaf7]|uniref:O-methyltransferase n=1 Tax=unclassified Rhodococcus (in: high G+C Gram-positive bacteria) TaxID=192944 RepID=UPI000700F62E|nr:MULTISPECIES: class I SAM-dependent methyltransferase [unclassified Rhodococcus (in: high G+C Gram-positive bacteria)]KQU06611.1 SAM-dependent methyltransferase [Rhodococcus sp. Leaf7]KQU42130.1 SAM-dependent methyltransferase [Rhodococcus sp. Leaf247]
MPDTHETAGPRPVTPTTIAAHELTVLCDEIASGSSGDDIVARLRRARDVVAGLDPYLDRCTSPETPALADLAARTRSAEWAGSALEQEMLSGHVEGQFLKFLVGMTGAVNVLEIGMFTGYSALAMAEELPAGGRVVACEVDRAVADFARSCFDASPVGDRIDIVVGPAADTLLSLASDERTFDLVFIDADKGGYLHYLNALLDSTLLAPRAVIAVDNTLLQGEPYLDESRSVNGSAIAAFNDAVAADPRVEQVVLPLRDGLTLIRRSTAS